MNKLTVKDIKINNNKVSVFYDVEGEWKQYFTDAPCFWSEYQSEMTSVPKSVAVIPFLGTIITASWLLDAEIILDELDEDFYNCLPEVKMGYEKMYPHVTFGGKVTVKNIIKNSITGNKSASLFSGGVDAFSTLISNIDKKPTLITIWGADINCENYEGWQKVEQQTINTSKLFNLDYQIIRSNFRLILNENVLHNVCLRIAGDGWWHGFHHGIGILSLVAPYSYISRVSSLYIASTFTADAWGTYTCSSDPVTDNFTRFCGCQVFHDGYEFSRVEKIQNIINYSQKENIKIPLRVCWESKNGGNCCHCEKCCRTILAIYANKSNPKDFGFDYEDINIAFKNFKYYELTIGHYKVTLEILRENYKRFQLPKSFRWIYNVSFDKYNSYQHRKAKEYDNFNAYLYSKSPRFLQKIYCKLK